MRFTEETRMNLARQGVIISNVPYSEEQYREERMKHYHEWLRVYFTESHYDSASGTFVTDEVRDQEKWDAETLKHTDNWMNSSSMAYFGRWYESTTLYILKGDMIFRRTVGKSQMITEDYVLKVIERDGKAYSGAYGQFAKDVNRMFSEKFGNNRGVIYPTTYGIGVWVFYNWRADECIANVESVLKSMEVEYRNEFSDANYVYRFVISKKAENRRRLA